MSIFRGHLLTLDSITEGKSPAIRLWCKDEDGKIRILKDRSFLPYFYILGADEEDVKKIRSSEGISPLKAERVKKKYFGREIEILRVYASHPGEVPVLRKVASKLGFETFEDDIPFHIRYLWDKGLVPLSGIEAEVSGDEVKRISSFSSPPPELKLLAFDTEVYNPRGTPDPERDPVIIISVCTEDGVEVFHGEERRIIRDFVNFVREKDPDVIAGYNHNSFDIPYLLKRCKKLGIELALGRDESPPKIRSAPLPHVTLAGRIDVDLYRVVMRDVGEVKVKKLENVAEFLGIQEAEDRVMIPSSEIYRYWHEDREKLIEYARDDALSTFKMLEKLLPIQIEFSRLIKYPLEDVSKMGRGRMVEMHLCAEAVRMNELIPKRRGEEGESYTGAVVLEPLPGIHEKVVLLDFSSMYPSIMISFNISPDTVAEGDEDAYVAPFVGHRFRKSPDGFFKRILLELIERRKRIKEELERNYDPLKDVEQQTLKILTNSFYGYTGWSSARWYRRECAEATTAWGRYFILKAVEIANSMGLQVIYGDTDSLFVKSDGDVLERARELSEKVSEQIPLELDVEALFETIFFTGKKKRYAGLTSEGKIIVRGLEVRRGDWCDLAREIQMKVIEIILKEKRVDKAVEYVREVIGKLKNGEIPVEKLVIAKTLTKKPSRYEASQPHVVAAMKAKRYGVEYRIGEKVPYVILSGSGGVSDRAEPFEILSFNGLKTRARDEELGEIDVGYYVENQIIPAVLRVLSLFGVTERDFQTGAQSTLEDFL